MSVTTTVYEKDGVDYGEWVDDFKDYEEDYYDIIHSFSDSKSTLLRIQDANGKRISSAVLLVTSDTADGNYAVLEVKRRGHTDFERKEHWSLEDWYISVVGNSDTYKTDMFDQIFIGDEKVPLWRILVVAVEGVDEDDDDDDDDNGVEGDDEADTPATAVTAYSSQDECLDGAMFTMFITLILAFYGRFVYSMLIIEGLQNA